MQSSALRLERLEVRTVPSTVDGLHRLQPPANDVFVATLYQGELQRPVDQSSLTFWNNQTGNRTQVAAAILNSNAAFSRAIATDFRTFLGRDPDAVGMKFYLQALQGGATPQQLKASIMGSDEFFARVGGSGTAFLNALYSSELGRSVDGQGQSFWQPLLGTAAGRAEIVNRVEGSTEATQRFVASLYLDFLGRTPDATGLAYWSGQLQQGQSQTTVLAGVLGSDEFFHGMESYVMQMNTTDPNLTASTFIADAHLFQGQTAVIPAPQSGSQGINTFTP